jgi:hypothetical protein
MVIPEGEQVMDLSFLLRAHAEWVARLREALYGDGALNDLMAADHEACQLGQWLKDMEPRYEDLPEYRAAKEIHKGFHRCAAHCLELINVGRRNDALAETEDEGELRHLSRRLVKELQQLNRAVSGGEERQRQIIDSQYE